MDELGDKLSAILNDPESMERVKQMAQSLWGEKPTAQLCRIYRRSLPHSRAMI